MWHTRKCAYNRPQQLKQAKPLLLHITPSVCYICTVAAHSLNIFTQQFKRSSLLAISSCFSKTTNEKRNFSFTSRLWLPRSIVIPLSKIDLKQSIGAFSLLSLFSADQ